MSYMSRRLGALETRYIDGRAQTVTHVGDSVVRLIHGATMRNITLSALNQDPFQLLSERCREAWRIMKYRFYDENMHGVDWRAARDMYEPLLPYVGMNQDVHDLANEMIGELNASHTGVSGPSGFETPPTYRTTYLGFEMEPEGNALQVTHVYREGPADRDGYCKW